MISEQGPEGRASGDLQGQSLCNGDQLSRCKWLQDSVTEEAKQAGPSCCGLGGHVRTRGLLSESGVPWKILSKEVTSSDGEQEVTMNLPEGSFQDTHLNIS